MSIFSQSVSPTYFQIVICNFTSYFFWVLWNILSQPSWICKSVKFPLSVDQVRNFIFPMLNEGIVYTNYLNLPPFTLPFTKGSVRAVIANPIHYKLPHKFCTVTHLRGKVCPGSYSPLGAKLCACFNSLRFPWNVISCGRGLPIETWTVQSWATSTRTVDMKWSFQTSHEIGWVSFAITHSMRTLQFIVEQ